MIPIITIHSTLGFLVTMPTFRHAGACLGRKQILGDKGTITENKRVRHWPKWPLLVKIVLNFLEVGELAHVGAPIRLGLEFDADTIHFPSSFLPRLFLPRRGAHTKDIPHFSSLLPSREAGFLGLVKVPKPGIIADGTGISVGYLGQLFDGFALY